MAVIYDSPSKTWRVWTGDREFSFQTAEEANQMSDKIRFAQQVQTLLTNLAQAMDQAPDLWQLYFDRGYNAGGAQVITDADLEAVGMTAAQMTSAITTIENFKKFCAGETPVNDVYRVTLNAVRRDV